ncbi:hypothetical protein BTA51_17695 [Hahella sp. CCB-MM4]|nr:hypothetical protein BTA51_17695 [Hahella sp. CCB-MM4]
MVIPFITMVGIICIAMLGVAGCMRAFYKKAAPGEVIILNSMEAKPRIVRNGALVLPIIHRASSLSLRTQTIEIEKSLVHKVSELYGVSLPSMALQVQESEEAILRAHDRINCAEKNGDGGRILQSVLSQAIQEAIMESKDYAEFKNHIATCLDRIGFEPVV